jgi:methylmalonyl-CoA mutase C-terminal domain/subunit
VIRILDQERASEIHLIAGGIIPVEDIPELKKRGVKEVFLPETKTDEIVFYIKGLIG